MSVTATMIFSEHVSPNQDGTVTILRAGINNVWRDTLPVPLQGALLVRIIADQADDGEHLLEIKLLDAQDKDAGLSASGRLGVRGHGGAIMLSLLCDVLLPAYGKYRFVTYLDGTRQTCDWEVTVSEKRIEPK